MNSTDTTESKKTATPYHLEGEEILQEDGGDWIAKVNPKNDPQFVLNAVNSHSRLKQENEVLKDVVRKNTEQIAHLQQLLKRADKHIPKHFNEDLKTDIQTALNKK